MALSDNWKIKGGANVPDWVSCASLNITDIRISQKNRIPATAQFTIPVQDGTADPIFPYGTTVAIQLSGTQIFYGKIRETPEAVISGTREALAYVVQSPLWDLEHIVYQQVWADLAGGSAVSTVYKSHITLSQDKFGNRITTDAQILDALNYAIVAGADLQIGSLFTGVMAPTRDANTISCAEVIRAMILWTPDVSEWLDMSTTPPTLYLKRRADLAAVSMAMTTDISDTLQIKRRDDIQVPCVALKYEQTSSVDGASYTNTTTDLWPLTANEQTINALVQTLQLSGTSTTLQKQSVGTAALPSSGAAGTTVVEWFLKKHPWLKKVIKSSSVMALIPGKYQTWIPEGQYKADGITAITNAWTVDDLPHELVSGSITDWMEKMYPSLETAQMNLWATFKFTGDLSNFTAEEAKLIQDTFSLNSSGANANTWWPSVTVMATNAATQVYSQVVSVTGGEEVPTGLAEQLYIALNTLHYEGGFTTTGVEISTALGLGNVFNLTGGRAEWATMKAQVQEIEWTGATGETTVKFGPPEHLSASDMLEFLRGLRTLRPVFLSSDARTSGLAQGAATVYGSGKTAINAVTAPPGGGGDSSPVGFGLTNASTSDGTKLGIRGGWIIDNVSSNTVVVTGLESYPDAITAVPVSDSYGYAWLYISYNEGSPASITAATFGTGTTLPSSESGTLVVPLGSYSIEGDKLTVYSAEIGNQSFYAWREWFSSPASYSAECNPA